MWQVEVDLSGRTVLATGSVLARGGDVITLRVPSGPVVKIIFDFEESSPSRLLTDFKEDGVYVTISNSDNIFGLGTAQPILIGYKDGQGTYLDLLARLIGPKAQGNRELLYVFYLGKE